jgi:hypothetical protein
LNLLKLCSRFGKLVLKGIKLSNESFTTTEAIFGEQFERLLKLSPRFLNQYPFRDEVLRTAR